MSGIYDSARQNFLTGQWNWTSLAVSALLIDDSVTIDQANHTHTTIYSTPTNAILTNGDYGDPTSSSLNPSAAAGVADLDDVTISAVGGTGETIEAIVLYVWTSASHTGTNNALVCYFDAFTPLATTGNDVQIVWPSSSPKVFKL